MGDGVDGRSVGVLLAPRGVEEPEFVRPRDALREAGADVVVIGLEPGDARTVTNDLDPAGSYAVDVTIDELDADGLAGLVVPGGTVGADTLRGDEQVVDLVQRLVARGRPVAAICHGPWVLVEADVVDGRRVTSYPSLATDLRNAGASWTDEEVVVDDGIVTSRTPDDLDAFCAALLEQLRSG